MPHPVDCFPSLIFFLGISVLLNSLEIYYSHFVPIGVIQSCRVHLLKWSAMAARLRFVTDIFNPFERRTEFLVT